MNISRAKKKMALKKAAVVSLLGSYTIWLSRYNKTLTSVNWPKVLAQFNPGEQLNVRR